MGQRIKHDKHGAGIITEFFPQGRVCVNFDKGEQHNYRPESQHKLHPLNLSGARVYHDKHGPGTVTDFLPDGRCMVHFDSGEEHNYRPESHHKLTPRDAFSSNDVIGFLRQGNKAARLFWHANDAGDLEIPDASEPEKVAYAMKLRYVEKRWVKVEGWTKEETRKVEAPKLHSRLTKARSSAMWSEQEDLYSRAQREEQVRAEADAAFQRFDVDGNGRISVRELKVALRELGFESSAYNTKALMKKFDDGSGGEAIGSGKLENATLELDEFRELVIGLRGGMKLMRVCGADESARTGKRSTTPERNRVFNPESFQWFLNLLLRAR